MRVLSLLVAGLLLGIPATGFAQASVDGPTSPARGALLGMYSGAGMGLVGSLMPCNRTLMGGSCAAAGATVGGVLGLVTGAMIGADDRGAIADRAEDALVGVAIGAVVGVGLRHFVRQYEWADAAALAAVGGAFGAAAGGVGRGSAVGAATGLVLWLARSDVGPPDVLMLVLGGAAVGGILDWADGATAGGPVSPRVSFSFLVG